MVFNDAIELENIKTVVSDIYSSVISLEDFGHCCIHSSAEKDLIERSRKIQDMLKKCSNELDVFLEEMKDWYGY